MNETQDTTFSPKDSAKNLIEVLATKVHDATEEHRRRPAVPGAETPDKLLDLVAECCQAGVDIMLFLKDHPRVVDVVVADLKKKFQTYLDLLAEVSARVDLSPKQVKDLEEYVAHTRGRASGIENIRSDRTESLRFFRTAMGLPVD